MIVYSNCTNTTICTICTTIIEVKQFTAFTNLNFNLYNFSPLIRFCQPGQSGWTLQRLLIMLVELVLLILLVLNNMALRSILKMRFVSSHHPNLYECESTNCECIKFSPFVVHGQHQFIQYYLCIVELTTMYPTIL